MLKIKKIEVNTPEYQSVLELRNRVLRKPLGMNLYDEDLSGDKDELIYGLFSHENKIVASVQFRILDEYTVKLRQMAVHHDFQRKGYGTLLVSFTEKQIKNLGYSEIHMHARKTAIPFYEKLGYQKDGNEFLEVKIPHFKMKKKL